MLTLTVWSRADILDSLNKRIVLMRHYSCWGSTYFGWLAVWGFNPDWRSEWKFRRFREASTPGGGNAGRAPSFHRIMPWNLHYNWGKSRQNLGQGSRKVLGKSLQSTIRLVHLATD